MKCLPVVRPFLLTCSLLVMSVVQGCLAGPALYEASVSDYNQAVRNTLDQQMLANLV